MCKKVWIGIAFMSSLMMSENVAAQDIESRIYFGMQSEQLNYKEKVEYEFTAFPSIGPETGIDLDFRSQNRSQIGFVGFERVGKTLEDNADMVGGVELGIMRPGSKDEGKTQGINYSIKARSGFYIKARGGLLLGEQFLLYGSVGYGSYDFQGEVAVDNIQGAEARGEFEHSGLEYGFGLEFLATKNLAIRVEYNFIPNFLDFINPYDVQPDKGWEQIPGTSVYSRDNTKQSSSRLGLGLVWRFNL